MLILENKEEANYEEFFENNDMSFPDYEGFSENNEFGNRQNPLYGVVYRNITDIPGFEQWKRYGGKIMDDYEVHRFGLSLGENNNGDIVFIFYEFEYIKGTWISESKILDTINIGKLKEPQTPMFYGFLSKETGDGDAEVFGIITQEETVDHVIYGEIVRAWRADMNTGRIIPIDINGIDYMSDFGRRLIKR